MNRLRAGFIVLLVQLALVMSIAGKYLYERKTRPRVWVRATQFDPGMPLRGRYLALQLLVNACGLPHDVSHYDKPYRVLLTGAYEQGWWHWRTSLTVANGHLVPQLAAPLRMPKGTYEIKMREDKPCDRAPIQSSEDLFISDTSRKPFPLQPGQDLWVEVTIPEKGPPRPIQLALSDASGFHPLRLD